MLSVVLSPCTSLFILCRWYVFRKSIVESNPGNLLRLLLTVRILRSRASLHQASGAPIMPVVFQVRRGEL